MNATLRTRLRKEDRDPLQEMLTACGAFNPAEVAVALELVDVALRDGPSGGYLFLLAEREGQLCGYTCYGKIPATESSFDLYWIVVHPQAQRCGLGTQLLRATEDHAHRDGATQLWIETSGRADYRAQRAFYESAGYHCRAVLDDFYAPGDAKCIYSRTLA